MGNDVADVVVVGFGAAGACAAIEAANAGADVLLIDRFSGGGATALSGGIVYAGGGTQQQRTAGFDDTPDAMYAYLEREVGDVVSPETLRAFCKDSADSLAWLEQQGVPFDATPCPYKTSYPNNEFYLYYSGSEVSGGFRDVTAPVPRGHRVHGRGTSGKVLFAALDDAVRRAGVRVMPQTRVRRLLTDDDGRVTGVEAGTVRGAAARRTHRRLAKLAAKPGLYVPGLRKQLQRQVDHIERTRTEPVTITARDGVVIAAGGFVANRAMMREHAPRYRGGLALGTAGDDGSGITMGQDIGGDVAHLDSVSAWRFITPPSAFLGGLIVDSAGARVIDESRYGAAIGEALITRHNGAGWLLVDDDVIADARRSVTSEAQLFQLVQVWYLLARGRVRDRTLAGVATRAGIDPAGLAATVAAHNAAAEAGEPDPMGKPAEFVRPLRAPFSLIDVSVRPSLGYPCPMLTLGGLVVAEDTGAVRRPDGDAIPGLYAAGRSAVGICSRSYVSGLSLADCVFSGRRAGKHCATARGDADKNENMFYS